MMLHHTSSYKANAATPSSRLCAVATALLLVISSFSTSNAFAPSHQSFFRTAMTADDRSRCSSSSSGSFGSSTARHALAVDAAVQGISQFSNTASAAYAYCLQAYQIPTQMATFGAFSATGDAIAQNVAALIQDDDNEESSSSSSSSRATSALDDESSTSSYDPERTFRYLLKGLGGGIIWSYWYGNVDPLALQLAQASLSSLEHLGILTMGAEDYATWEQPARI
eukprot:scaffold1695_cov167-Amphora_coffeaeformis.AAC.1